MTNIQDTNNTTEIESQDDPTDEDPSTSQEEPTTEDYLEFAVLTCIVAGLPYFTIGNQPVPFLPLTVKEVAIGYLLLSFVVITIHIITSNYAD